MQCLNPKLNVSKFIDAGFKVIDDEKAKQCDYLLYLHNTIIVNKRWQTVIHATKDRIYIHTTDRNFQYSYVHSLLPKQAISFKDDEPINVINAVRSAIVPIEVTYYRSSNLPKLYVSYQNGVFKAKSLNKRCDQQSPVRVIHTTKFIR